MKKHTLWKIVLDRFFIMFNLTKTNERPSKDKKALEQGSMRIHTVSALVLPEKETVMIDEFSGYTKTQIKIEEVYEGNLSANHTLKISEPYYESYYGGERCMIVREHYEPLVIGKAYVFKLCEDEVAQGMYRVIKCEEEMMCKTSFHKVS